MSVSLKRSGLVSTAKEILLENSPRSIATILHRSHTLAVNLGMALEMLNLKFEFGLESSALNSQHSSLYSVVEEENGKLHSLKLLVSLSLATRARSSSKKVRI